MQSYDVLIHEALGDGTPKECYENLMEMIGTIKKYEKMLDGLASKIFVEPNPESGWNDAHKRLIKSNGKGIPLGKYNTITVDNPTDWIVSGDTKRETQIYLFTKGL